MQRTYWSGKATKKDTTTTILIGNPGVGKSTLLNCLLGKNAGFKSGVSFGGGLTQVLQMYTAPDGNRFADTPGLSDAVMRKKAALEIENGLKQGGTFKIFFVVVLESGRVRPEDITTIKLILEGVPQIKSNYSIIINKIPKPTHQKLTQNENDRMQVVTLLNISGTFKVYCNMRCEELEDVNDCVIPLDPQLIQFINNAPQVIISPERVEHIKANEFEKLHEELSAKLTTLNIDNTGLNDTLAKQKNQMTQLEKKHKQELAEMQEQIQKEREQYEEERRSEQDAYYYERKREEEDFYYQQSCRREEFYENKASVEEMFDNRYKREEESMDERHRREQDLENCDFSELIKRQENARERLYKTWCEFYKKQGIRSAEFERNQTHRESEREKRVQRRDSEREKREERKDKDRQRLEERLDRRWRDLEERRIREERSLAQQHQAELQLQQYRHAGKEVVSDHKRAREELELGQKSKRECNQSRSLFFI